MHSIRTEGNVLVAKVSNQLAIRIINESDGRWETKNFVKTGRRSVFVFKEPSTWSNSHIEIFIWKGFYIDGVE